MAVMERISFEQLNSQLAMTILASWGSRGNSAIMEPSSVRSPSSLSAASDDILIFCQIPSQQGGSAGGAATLVMSPSE
ncbi:hypothetical protein EYF80_034438 [Liparis tanakae]|uniref:Uncharacterized protein n=1 Tax=Liparis tanakae TaxID=230148 RepID=A0A4Z2GQJ2_9TELE|nr:hypothetical protein EYF80_034438 [Liparis tanakae]